MFFIYCRAFPSWFQELTRPLMSFLVLSPASSSFVIASIPFWVGVHGYCITLYTFFLIFGFCTLDLWFWSFSLVCILLVIFFSCIAFVYHALASYWASHICHEYSSILMWTDALDCGVCAMHCLYSWRNEIEILWAKPLNWIWIVNAYHPWVAFC